MTRIAVFLLLTPGAAVGQITPTGRPSRWSRCGDTPFTDQPVRGG